MHRWHIKRDSSIPQKTKCPTSIHRYGALRPIDMGHIDCYKLGSCHSDSLLAIEITTVMFFTEGGYSLGPH